MPRKLLEHAHSWFCSILNKIGALWNTTQSDKNEIIEIANTADLDEAAHNEPPHLDLHCLPFCL